MFEKARTNFLSMHYGSESKPWTSEYGDDVIETDPDLGYTVVDRNKVTNRFDEGLKVHNPSTFRLEPPADGSTDSPFA